MDPTFIDQRHLLYTDNGGHHHVVQYQHRLGNVWMNYLYPSNVLVEMQDADTTERAYFMTDEARDAILESTYKSALIISEFEINIRETMSLLAMEVISLCDDEPMLQYWIYRDLEHLRIEMNDRRLEMEIEESDGTISVCREYCNCFVLCNM